MIVFSEGAQSAAAKTMRAVAIAEILGIQIHSLAISELAFSAQPTLGIWLDFPPSIAQYTAVYQAVLAKNIRLPNTPIQHAIAQDFDRAYDVLKGLVPQLPSASSWQTVRQQTPLRYHHTAAGVPVGRSFRVFVYDQTILTYGYGWEIDDPLKWLTVEDEDAIFLVVLEAARLLDVPFVAIEVGQLEPGDWVILEIGDAQFARLNTIPLIQLWLELEKVAA